MAAEGLIDELLEDARQRMLKSVESAQHEFSTVRTGRASPSLYQRRLGVLECRASKERTPYRQRLVGSNLETERLSGLLNQNPGP